MEGKEPTSKSAGIDSKRNIGSHYGILPQHPMYPLHLPHTTSDHLFLWSFSALRQLKTWLRSSMGNERLSGLAMMHMHRNRALDPEKVLRRWDASGHRRIALAFDKKVTSMLDNL